MLRYQLIPSGLALTSCVSGVESLAGCLSPVSLIVVVGQLLGDDPEVPSCGGRDVKQRLKTPQ